MKGTGNRNSDDDRLLWQQVKHVTEKKRGGHPSPEEMAQFLDHRADDVLQERIFSWLASDEGAVEELRLLRELSGGKPDINEGTLNLAKSRLHAIISRTVRAEEKPSWFQMWVDTILDFASFRGWLTTAAAACILVFSGVVAFRLGSETFQYHQRAESAIAGDLTFGLLETLPPGDFANHASPENGGM